MNNKVREGYKMTEVGEIPVEWEIKKLEEISNKIGDGLHGTPIYSENGEYYFINGNNLMNGKIFFTNETKRVSETEYCKYKKELTDSTLLISLNGTIGNLAYYNFEKVVLGKSSGYISLKDIVNKNYIFFALRNKRIQTYFLKELTGTTIKNLSLNTLRRTPIIIPTIPEQNRIASILSTVDTQINQTAQLIKKTKELKKGLMQKLLTKGIGHTEFKKSEVGEIPVEWEVKELKDIGKIITGNTPKTSQKENYGEEYLWVSPADLSYEKYITRTNKMLSKVGFAKTRQLPKGSILVTCIGSTIGKIGIAGQELSTNQQINSIICKEISYSEYVYYAIDFNFSTYMSFISTQAVPIINKTVFSEFNIAVPSLMEQRQIADILSSVDTQIEEYENKKTKLQELKKGLMQQLLTGKIRA